MTVRRFVVAVVVLFGLAGGVALWLTTSADRPTGLPLYDQAMQDNAPRVDPANPAHQQLVAAGWGILVAEARFTDFAGATVTATKWYHDGYAIYTVGSRIIAIGRMDHGLTCDVPATPVLSPQEVQTQFEVILAAPSDDGINTVLYDTNKQAVYHCHEG